MSKMTCIVYAEPVVKVNRRGNIEEKGNLDLSFQILHSFSVPTAMIMKSAVKKRGNMQEIIFHECLWISTMLTLFLSSSSISWRTSPVPWGLKKGSHYVSPPAQIGWQDLMNMNWKSWFRGVKTESEQLASDLLSVHVVQEHLPLIQGPDGGIQ